MAVAAPVTRPFPAVEGVSHRYVDVDGLRMHVAEAGSGEPLVLLHGWPQHWYEWRYQIPVLAEHFHVICPDLRGFGWSDAPPGLYDKETLAADISKLIAVLELERVRLIGHDWGGWIGFLLCLFHPEQVSKYLALNIPPPWPKTDLRTVGATYRFWYQWLISTPGLGAWTLRNRPGFVEYIIRGTSKRSEAWSDDDLAAFTEVLREPARAEATVHLYRTFTTREFPSLVRGRYNDRRLVTPTLLLFGTEDFAISTAFLRGYEQHADDLTIELVPDTGHFIAEEKPELVNERALEFFGAAAAQS
jgi:pimeloyl-ACP methyl ester carboxylesterase